MGRKRALIEEVPESSSPKSCKVISLDKHEKESNVISTSLDSVFLVEHPQELFDFWEFVKTLDPNSPRNAFEKLMSLTLVGPFRCLAGENNSNMLTQDRFSTDLPEMQTVMVYENGRFCYWRDCPTDSQPILIHVTHEEQNFPEIKIVGDSNLFCAVHYLIKNLKKAVSKTLAKNFFPQKYDFRHYDSLAFEVKKSRSKATIGSPFHGLGLKIELKDDLGYRPVTDNPKQLKSDIQSMATTIDASLKEQLRAKLLELHTFIQFANDENDFGMGLEFGHDLFLSNYACYDTLIKNVLKNAYELLGRSNFHKILQAHFESGR